HREFLRKHFQQDRGPRAVRRSDDGDVPQTRTCPAGLQRRQSDANQTRNPTKPGIDMSISTNVVIIGAGPYGLSIAAHLRQRGIEFRIFGSPLRAWRSQMPKDMFLKSEGFAAKLYDPHAEFTLERFCKENDLAYAHHDNPVPLGTFAAYGVAFQQRFVADLEE